MGNNKTVNQMLIDRDIRFYDLLTDEIIIDSVGQLWNWNCLYTDSNLTVLQDARPYGSARHIIANCSLNELRYNDRTPIEMYNAQYRVYGTATLRSRCVRTGYNSGYTIICANGIDADNFITV